jgi:hypothetical protein
VASILLKESAASTSKASKEESNTYAGNTFTIFDQYKARAAGLRPAEIV